jgi:hypothetical protein
MNLPKGIAPSATWDSTPETGHPPAKISLRQCFQPLRGIFVPS